MSDSLSADLASLKIDRRPPPVDPERRSRLRTAVAALVVVAALAGAGVYAYPHARAALFKTEVRVTEVLLVSPAQASVRLTSTGYVVPQVVSKVGAKVPGRIAVVNVKEGSVVESGEILALQEDADVKAAIASARTRVAAASARVATARAQEAEVLRQAARERSLLEQGFGQRAVLEDLEMRARSLAEATKAAEAEVTAAESEVAALEVALRDRIVRSPIRGIVIGKPIVAGELVGIQAEKIAEVADFDSLMVETDVPEARFHLVELGRPCEIVLDAYPRRRYRGVVRELGMKVNRSKATVLVKVAFLDEKTGVLPEMSARVSFLAKEIGKDEVEQPPRPVVPDAAVVTRGGGDVVFAIDDGKVRMVPVTLGEPFGSGRTLVKGPPPGTRLVAGPPPEMADGQAVKEKTE